MSTDDTTSTTVDGTTQRKIIDTGDEPVDEDDEVIDEDVGLTRSGLMRMVGKNIVCDECVESSFRIKQGVDSNRCRHCGNIIEDAWSDDDD